jgi:hypothetical protein
MTFIQIGLVADIVGFVVIAGPALFWRHVGIPFLPRIGEWRWLVYLLGVVLIIVGFSLQIAGTVCPNFRITLS